jgi:hypothetical protein
LASGSGDAARADAGETGGSVGVGMTTGAGTGSGGAVGVGLGSNADAAGAAGDESGDPARAGGVAPSAPIRRDRPNTDMGSLETSAVSSAVNERGGATGPSPNMTFFNSGLTPRRGGPLASAVNRLAASSGNPSGRSAPRDGWPNTPSSNSYLPFPIGLGRAFMSVLTGSGAFRYRPLSPPIDIAPNLALLSMASKSSSECPLNLSARRASLSMATSRASSLCNPAR